MFFRFLNFLTLLNVLFKETVLRTLKLSCMKQNLVRRYQSFLLNFSWMSGFILQLQTSFKAVILNNEIFPEQHDWIMYFVKNTARSLTKIGLQYEYFFGILKNSDRIVILHSYFNMKHFLRITSAVSLTTFTVMFSFYKSRKNKQNCLFKNFAELIKNEPMKSISKKIYQYSFFYPIYRGLL